MTKLSNYDVSNYGDDDQDEANYDKDDDDDD